MARTSPVSDMSGRFSGINAGYIAELFERYQQDPNSVDQATREAFAREAPVFDRGPSAGAPGQPVAGWRRDRRRSDGGHRRRGQSRGIAAEIRASEGPGRSARQASLRPLRRSDARTRGARRDAGRSPAAAGEPDRRADRGARGQRARSDRGAEQGLLLHHRLRLRAHLRGRRARVAALRGGVGPVPAAGRSAGQPRAARSAVAGGSVRAVPAPHVPGQDALLGRRPRHADSGSRRDRREGGVGWHLARVDRHGASRPAQRARARAAEAVRADPRRVQGSGAATQRLPHRPRVDGRREVSRRARAAACAA